MNLIPLDRVNALLVQKPPFTAAEIRKLIQQEPEIAVFLILEQSKRIRELEALPATPIAPSTPSGMIPPYQKPKTSGRKKKPGRKPGHPAARRDQPTRIDRKIEHRLACCPDCGGPLQKCNGDRSARTRIIEEIPQTQPEVTEHTIHRDYCPHCKKSVEPQVPDALPKATVGNRALALSAYWHYALGLTGAQILETLNTHFQFPLSAGGLTAMWQNLAALLRPWYEQIVLEARAAAVLHADETGWRVNGQTHWLWCFTEAQTTIYLIDRSRGAPALQQFFQETFAGTLVSDFWAAYDHVTSSRHQCCLSHLLGELKKVNQRHDSDEWQIFSKKTQRLFQDALRLRAREDYSPSTYASRREALYRRLLDLALAEYQDREARRLAKRLEKYRDEWFTFLEHPEVPATNNHAEREIRFAVLIRKITYGNRSDRGARTQSILMSIFRTLKRRGYNPVDQVVSALRIFVLTGSLPPFPPPLTSDH